MPKSPVKSASILAFGAHPDDIEFGCGGVIACESHSGRSSHFVICSRGEAGTNGTPTQRTAESTQAASLLGASVEFISLDGDALLELKVAHAVKIARIIRRVRPRYVIAPTLEENQHPDHARLGRLVRDAARLARYGGLKSLRELKPHAIEHLLYYAVTPDAEPRGISPVLIDVSAPDVLAAWTASMAAHASQLKTRSYVELQLARATVNGSRSGVKAAIPLFPNDPLLFGSLNEIQRSARRF